MSQPRPERAVCAAAASAWAFASMPAAFSLGRIAQLLAGPRDDTMVPSGALLAAIVALVTVATFVVTWRWFATRPEAAGRWLLPVLMCSVAWLAVQGVLLP